MSILIITNIIKCVKFLYWPNTEAKLKSHKRCRFKRSNLEGFTKWNRRDFQSTYLIEENIKQCNWPISWMELLKLV